MTLLSRCKYLLTGSISYSLYTLSRSNGFCTQCHSPICTRFTTISGARNSDRDHDHSMQGEIVPRIPRGAAFGSQVYLSAANARHLNGSPIAHPTF